MSASRGRAACAKAQPNRRPHPDRRSLYRHQYRSYPLHRRTWDHRQKRGQASAPFWRAHQSEIGNGQQPTGALRYPDILGSALPPSPNTDQPPGLRPHACPWFETHIWPLPGRPLGPGSLESPGDKSRWDPKTETAIGGSSGTRADRAYSCKQWR